MSVSRSFILVLIYKTAIKFTWHDQRYFQKLIDRLSHQNFIWNRNLYQTEKRALTLIIYLSGREEISVLRLFQFQLIGKWASGNQSRTSTFWKTLLLKDECLFWNFLDPENVQKTVLLVKFTKSKPHNFIKKLIENNETQAWSASHGCWLAFQIEALECLYRSTGLIFLLRWREDFNLYLRNTTMKFGKSLVNSFWEVFLKKKVTNAHMHARTNARTWLSLY